MHSLKDLRRVMEQLEDRVLFDAVPDGGFLVQPESTEQPLMNQEQQVDTMVEEADEQPRELILVDANVEDADQLIAEILETQQNQSFEIRLLSADRNGIEQISEILDGASGAYDAIHILSHGAEGEVQLGNSTVDAVSLSNYAADIIGWSDKLTEDADLLIYGCNLAGSQAGIEFTETLSTMTGADVAASTDLTGHEDLGGDWELEHRVGSIEAEQLSIKNYFGTLSTFVIRTTSQPVVAGGGGVGTTGTWANAGFVDTDETVDADGDGDFNNDQDILIDIVATVIETTGSASVDFETVSETDPAADDMRARVSGAGTATVRWEVFEAGTTNKPTAGNIGLTISDIDGAGGNPNTVEGVSASLSNLSSYTLQSPTNLEITVNDDFLEAQGTQNQNSEEPSWVRFDWATANELVLTYHVYDNGTRFFNHDGDGDLIFSNPNTNFTQGIDLDTDNSSGATGSNYQTTYIDGSIPGSDSDVPVAIADADISIFDINDTTLEGASIVLTNASAGDQLNVNNGLMAALGITANVDTSVPGEIRITLSGTALIENYESAIKSITYSNNLPTFDQSYVRTVEVNATDGTNTTGTAVTTIDFATAVNTPTAEPDFYVIDEDSSLTTTAANGLLLNDDDPQGDGITITSAQDSAGNFITIGSPHVTPSGATLTLNADGTFTYVPAAEMGGAEFFTYTIDDGNGNTDTAFATINVNPIADIPTLILSYTDATVNEDVASIPLVINASTPDTDGSETLTVVLSEIPPGATITDGTNTFIGSAASTSVDVSGWNLNNIQFVAAAHSDVDQSVRVTTTTTEPNGDSQSVTEVVNYTVDAVADAPNLSVNSTSGSVDQPINLTSQISASLVDTDGSETLTEITISNIPAGAQILENGTPLTITGGSVTITPAQLANNLTFMPPSGSTGTFTIQVSATAEETNPENGVAVASATTGPLDLTITIDNIDEVVTPHDDVTIVGSGQTVTFVVLGNDEVPDGGATITEVDGQAIVPGGSVILTSGDGTVTLNADGTLTFAPSNAANGNTIQFGYTVEDYDGDSSSATVHVSVTNPIVDDVATTDEDVTVTIDVLANDGTGGGILPLTITNQSATDGANGTTTVNPDGTIDYTPNNDYNGVDSFDYTLTGLAEGLQYQFFEGQSNWRSLDDIPDVDPDFVGVANSIDSEALSSSLTGSDRDYGVRYFGQLYVETGDSYTFSLSSNNGSRIYVDGVLVADNNNAGGTSSNTGTITLTSGYHEIVLEHYDFGGASSLTATMSGADTGGATVSLLNTGRVGSAIVTQTATVDVTIDPVNDDPVGSSIPGQSSLDDETITPLDVSGYFNDADGDSLSYTAVGLPSGLSIDANTGVISGTIDDSASTGGPYSVTITADDGNGGTPAQESFTWNVTNPAPNATDDAGSTTENATTGGNVVTADNGNGVDSDPDGDALSVSAVNGSAGSVGASIAGSGGGSFTINANGSYSFDPGSDFDYLALGESATTTATYTVSDGEGGTSSATLTITVGGENDDPNQVGTVNNQSSVDNESITPLSVAGFFADPDASDTLTFSDGGTLPPGLSIDPNTGLISGTIDNSASTGGPYTVVITADDGNGGTTTQTFNWNVTNPGPTAQDDDLSTNQGGSLSGSVFSNNSNGVDSDPDGDTITVTLVEGAAGNVGGSVAGSDGGTFTINANGSYNFAAGADFDNLAVGETRDTEVTYTISDGEGGTSTATVTVTVTGTNDDPTTVGSIPAQSNLDNESITPLNVSSFFDDVDASDTLMFSASGTLPPGLSIDANTGLISGTLDNSASTGGPYTVVITADDGNGGTTTQAFNWNVTNPGPTAQDDDLGTNQGGSLAGSVFSNNGNGADSDPDGDTITVTLVEGSAGNVSGSVAGSDGGTFTINANGSYDFDAGSDFDNLAVGETRDTEVTYTISDGEGGTSTATVTVTVTGTNDDPTTVGGIPAQSNLDNESITPLNVSGFFDDVDASDTLTFSDGGTLPPGLSIDPNTGLISGTLDSSASTGGPYTVVITADDGNGGTTTQTFNWNVTNPGPTAQDDDLGTNQGGSLAGSVFSNNGNGADSDPDGDTIVVTAIDGVGGNVGSAVGGSNGGTFTINANGSYNFDAGSDFDNLAVGETRDTEVTYTISDGEGGTSIATVTVTVTGTNDDPTTVGSIPAQSNLDNESITPLNVSSFFDDVDASDTLAFNAGGTLPPGLSIDANTGLISGTLDNSASTGGPYTVVITADDGNGGTTTQAFNWNVTNPGPTAQDDDLGTNQGGSLAGSVFSNNGNGVDSDPDGDTITVTLVEGAAGNVGGAVGGSNGGTFTINANGSYNFDAGSDFDNLAVGETRDTEVTYTISDGEGGTSTATVTVTVTGTNDDPTTVGSIPAQSNLDNESITPLDVSGFFDDVDASDTLTYSTGGTLPPGLSIDPNTGLISGTLDNSASTGGPYTVVITADDGNGGTTTQTFNWNVTNPGPTAQDDDLSTNQGGSLSGSVFSNNGNGADSDPDGDTITVTLVEGSAGNVSGSVAGSDGGTFTINANGSYDFDAGSDFDNLAVGETRDTEVTYTISDGEGGTSTATVTVTVTGTNDDPTTVGSIPAQSNLDNESITPLNVSSFFDDVDASDTLTFSASGTLPPGLSIDANSGLISGTLDNSASTGGPYTVVITADDGNGGITTQTFNWNVTNPGPTAQDDAIDATEGGTSSGSVFTDNGSGADSDPDGDAIAVSSVDGSAVNVGVSVAGTNGGTFTINANGDYNFDAGSDFDDLAAGQSRLTQVTYAITDGEGGTDTATVTVTVTGANAGPVAVGTIPSQENQDNQLISPLIVSGYFTDPDASDTLTFSAGGTLPPGLSIDPNTGLISGTIDNSASTGGPYTVVITADDGNGGTTTQTFNWNVTNPGPTAQDDDLSTNQGGSLSGSVFSNNGNGVDSDPDGDTITVTLVEGSAGNVGGSVAGSDGGTFTINANGSYDFDAGSDFDNLAVGETRDTEVTYTISDGEGGTSTATVTVTVTGTNDDPTTVGSIPAQSNLDNESITPLNVSGFFADPDASDTLTFSGGGTLPPGLSIDPNTGLISGTLDNSASTGGPYTVVITADDGNGGTTTQTFNWNVTNPGPTAQDDDLSTNQGGSLAGSVFSNNGNGVDSDPDGDTITVTLVEGAAGNVGGAVGGSNGGTFTINANGSYNFNAGADFDNLAVGETRDTEVTYTISDGEGGTSTATVTVTVTGTNDDPTTVGSIPAQSNLDNESITPLNVSSFFDDVDASDTLTFSDGGTLPPGLSLDPNTGLISGTIDNSASTGGPYTVVITADDGNGGTTTQTFNWNVTNPGPTAQDDDLGTNQGGSLTGSVFVDNGNGADSDPDGDTIVVTAIDGAAGNVGSAVSGTNGGTFTIDANGSYSFDAGGDFNDLAVGQTRQTEVTYVISDGEGGTSLATVTVTVTGTNDGPSSTAIPAQSNNDGETISPLDVSGYFDDIDGDTLTFADGGSLPPGLSIDPTTGVISGTLDPDASDNGPYSVTITVNDGNGGTTSQTFNWVINNALPTAEDDEFATNQGGSVTGNVFADNNNGVDFDADGDPISVTEVNGNSGLVNAPVSGSTGGTFTLQSDGSLSFVAGGDFDDLGVGQSRTTEVTYTIDDGQGGVDTATVTVTVSGLNDAPVTVGTLPAQNSNDGDTIAPLGVSGFFDDIDSNDTLTYSDGGTLPPGLALDPSTGLISGTIDNSASTGGPYSVVITVDDGHGGTTSQSFTWNVSNPGPVAMDDQLVTDQGIGLAGSLFVDNGNGVDSDPDGDTITIVSINGAAAGVGSPITGSSGGTFIINDDGSYSFDPGSDFDNLAVGAIRDTQVTYTISDGEGGTSQATVTVTVQGTNDDPQTVGTIPAQSNDDSETITSMSVSGFFTDLDNGDTLTFSDGGSLPPGLTIDSVTGEISGTIDSDASVGGPYTVVIQADDGNGGSTTQMFTWNVLNPGPSAADDAATVSENGSTSGSVFADNGNGVDSDPDGDRINVVAVNGASSSVGSVVTGSNGGSFTINPNGSYDFETGSDFDNLAFGETRDTEVTYTISDGQGGTSTATVTITVTGENDDPNTIGSIPAQSGEDAETIASLDLSNFFADPDTSDTLTYSDGGSLPPGLSLDPTTGVVSGTLDPSASTGGPYTVVVTADDGNGGTSSQTFTWNVTNPGPTAQDDNLNTNQGGSLAGNVLADNGSGADFDPDGDSLQVTAIDGDSSLVSAPVTGSNGGSFTIAPDGSYTFDAGSDFDDLGVGESRQTVVTYTVDDGEGGASTATVEVTVVGSNDTPTPVGMIGTQDSIDGETIKPINISNFFDDLDTTDQLTFSDGGTLPPGLSVNPSTGVISGTIDNSASTGGPYTVVITADDGNGGTTTQTIVWNVDNPGPVATNDRFVVTGDNTVTGNVMENDADQDGDKMVVSAINGSAANVGIVVQGTTGGSFVILSDGSLEFDPGNDFDDLKEGESRRTQVTYTISDGQGGTSSTTVTIVVRAEETPAPEDPQTFAFDSFNNEATPLSPNVIFGQTPQQREFLLSQRIETLAPEPILAGHARPGTVLVARIYAEDGSILGEATDTANQAGNWILSFSGVNTKGGGSTRIVIEHVANEAVALGETEFTIGRETYRTMQFDATHRDAMTAGSILSGTASQTLDDLDRQNINPLNLL